MAWIETISPEQAAPDLKQVYDRITSSRGKLSNIMAIQSLDPAAMAAHLDLYVALMFSRADYALALTRVPADVPESAISGLRTHGLSDGDILKLNMIVAYFNFVNRIAEGLGVELGAEEAAGYRY